MAVVLSKPQCPLAMLLALEGEIAGKETANVLPTDYYVCNQAFVRQFPF
jgi:hypothetical protein